VLYFSEFNQGVMRNPHVQRYWTHDVYISPIELKTGADAAPQLALAKGQSGSLGNRALRFEDFERQGTMGDPNGFTLVARVAVGEGADAQVVKPSVKITPYGLEKHGADLPGGGMLTLVSANPNTGTAEFVVTGPGAAAGTDVLAVEISTKPLIGLVWVGMGILLFGAGLGIRRRLALRRQESVVRGGALAPVPAEP
jgi:cytochrome c biogenesis factor